jgi:hypothetical protein
MESDILKKAPRILESRQRAYLSRNCCQLKEPSSCLFAAKYDIVF